MEQDLAARKQRALRRSQAGWAAAMILLAVAVGVAGPWFWPGLAAAGLAAVYGLWQGVLWRNAVIQSHPSDS